MRSYDASSAAVVFSTTGCHLSPRSAAARRRLGCVSVTRITPRVDRRLWPGSAARARIGRVGGRGAALGVRKPEHDERSLLYDERLATRRPRGFGPYLHTR